MQSKIILVTLVISNKFILLLNIKYFKLIELNMMNS